MGKVKSACMFQAITQRAVEADMAQPDQRDRQRRVTVERNADGGQCQWSDGRVRHVVRQRADARSQHVTGKTQVGNEKQKREPAPAASDARVERDRGNQQHEPFCAQQRSHAAVDCPAEPVIFGHGQNPHGIETRMVAPHRNGNCQSALNCYTKLYNWTRRYCAARATGATSSTSFALNLSASSKGGMCAESSNQTSCFEGAISLAK